MSDGDKVVVDVEHGSSNDEMHPSDQKHAAHAPAGDADKQVVSPTTGHGDGVNVDPKATEAARRGLRPPPFIESLTPERRQELELHLRRKIDWRLLPMIVIMYILNYIDRNNIAAARLAGLERDLHLPTNSTEFQVRTTRS
jgi:hypothetical protein